MNSVIFLKNSENCHSPLQEHILEKIWTQNHVYSGGRSVRVAISSLDQKYLELISIFCVDVCIHDIFQFISQISHLQQILSTWGKYPRQFVTNTFVVLLRYNDSVLHVDDI